MIIAHLTSAHKRNSTRIFHKMCKSMVKYSQVYFVCADGKEDEFSNDVNILDVGSSNNRFDRMTITVNKIYNKAIDLNADIYHLHDPELIRIGLKLLKKGKKVIFDSHEHVGDQILGKDYIPRLFSNLISKLYMIYEKYSLKKFSGLIGATPRIRDHLLKINPKTIDINNFPKLEEANFINDWKKKSNEIAYVGTLIKIRGVEEIIKSLDYTTGVHLNLAGNFGNKNFEIKVKKLRGWRKVKEMGYLNREQVVETLKRSKVGIVTLHPKINYLDSQPVKMFEYMAAGIPIIASDFPYWKNIVEGNKCGICLNPLDPKAIGQAIQYFFENPNESKKMGENGVKAVKNKFNWSIEEKKLITFYKKILN